MKKEREEFGFPFMMRLISLYDESILRNISDQINIGG
jgi:hypothetical protein